MEIIVGNKTVLLDDEDYAKVEGWSLSLVAGGSYVMFGPKEDRQYLHRVIVDAPKGLSVHHINHNTLDNRKSNLRICTHAENRMSTKGLGSNPYGRGISWHKNGFRVRFVKDGIEHYFGRYESLEDAVRARDAWIKVIYGEFAYV